jgi:putative transposase
MRKEKLVNGKVYHILNKSIAGFEIFKDGMHCSRIIKVIRYYQKEKPLVRFSDFIKTDKTKQNKYPAKAFSPSRESLVEIIAYCIMPTHFHLILKQLKDRGISIFMNNIQNSYTRYFNIRHKRKGPLWQGRFKNVLVDNDEYLLHLTRYIHLNPVTAYLVDIPENWGPSSYWEYLLKVNEDEKICRYEEILDIEPNSYKGFVQDRISYQRELAKIKDLLLE